MITQTPPPASSKNRNSLRPERTFMNVNAGVAALLSSVLLAATVFAQSADPMVAAATHVPATIAVGQSSQLRTDFANAGFGPIPATSIKLSICGADIYYQTNGATPPSGYGSNFTWTQPSTACWEGINNVAIAPGSGGVITLNYTGLLVTPSPQTTTVNLEVVAHPEAFALDNTSNNQLTATLDLVSPLLTKSFGNTSIADGGVTTLSFTLTASNTAPASSISFADTLPTGLRIANPANVGGSCTNSVAATSAAAGGGTITISGVNVPAGPSSCTVTVQVTNVAGQSSTSCTGNPTAFTNGASNISGLSSIAVNGVQPSCLVVNAAMAAISLVKTGPASMVAGGSVPYSLTLTNNGSAAQPSGFVFYEIVPTNTTFASVANATSSCAVGSVAGTLCALTTTAPVAAGASLVVTYTVTVNASLPSSTTTIANAIYTAPPAACTGSVCPAPVCPDAAAASCTTTPTAPVIGFAKSSSATSIAAGASVPYSLTLTNTGGAAQPSGFAFYEVVPTNTTFASVANATSSCAVGAVAGTLCALTTTAPVAAGGSLVVTFTVTVNASISAGTATLINAIYTAPPSGCVGSTCPAPVCPDSAAVACSITPSSPPSFSMVLTKLAGTPTVMFGANSTIHDAGDTIAYTFSVTNTGTVAIAQVTVADAKLPTTVVLPGASAKLTCTNNVYTMTSADVAAGRVINTASARAVPASCTPAVVPCPSTQMRPSTAMTPLVSQSIESAQPIPTTSTWALLLLSLMLMAGTGLVARSKR